MPREDDRYRNAMYGGIPRPVPVWIVPAGGWQEIPAEKAWNAAFSPGL
ncbi:hypothetical protein C1G86_0057 [Dehalococcoides mccartyi]|uniref:Uncharacterized protein n=1 Tax=Dehalococcoides mccartyi TaxID=61435 RepID=A0A328ETX8_9CHLR|nr:hypothetical protein C1G86_0057 [Dehalococcoides mccartyi]